MQVRMSQVSALRFTEGDHDLIVHYGNRGEPFRDGVEFVFDSHEVSNDVSFIVLLERSEVEQLRNKLNEFLASK